MDDIFMGDGFIDFVAFGYHVEIVIVMDATESMKPIMNEVKDNVLKLCRKFAETMEEDGKEISVMRVKVIAFRDYIIDSVPMLQSEFFELPAQNHQFKAFLDNIEASGGGDEPENSLESLAYALMSDWTNSGMPEKRRYFMMGNALVCGIIKKIGNQLKKIIENE